MLKIVTRKLTLMFLEKLKSKMWESRFQVDLMATNSNLFLEFVSPYNTRQYVWQRI